MIEHRATPATPKKRREDQKKTKKKTPPFTTPPASPSRSRIFKGLLANASTVTEDKENVFAYAATDEKENDHY